jgi:uncharacterized protein YggE
MRMLTLVAWLAAAVPAAAQTASHAIQTPVVVTTGDAVVRRTPDRAFVNIAVEVRAKNPRDAQRQNADAMTAVRQRLTQARVANDAVTTLGYTLDQEFEMVQNNRVPAGFVARNTIEVRIDDTTRVGEILDLVVRGGANSVAGIRFDLKDRAEAEREALRLAVADARSRAEAAAAGAGVTVERVLQIEDRREPVVVPRPMMMAARVAEPTTPVEAGSIEIRASVTLTAAIR